MPKTLDDLWHLYNIITKGDLVYSRTTREVKTDAEYSRPKKGKRVSVFLGLTVEDIVWDRNLNRLRIRGRIYEATDDIAGKGTHHALSIAVNKAVTIVKDKWLKHQIDRLERAGLSEAPPVIVVCIDSEEYCIAVIRQYGVDVQVEGKANLPSKLEAERRTEALKNYFGEALTALKELWKSLSCSIVIIGVGFIKNQYAKYLEDVASEVAKAVVDVKGVNSGGVVGIQEALRSGVLEKTLKNLRIAEEARAVEEVLKRLGRENRNVTYGLEQVNESARYGAVETLMVADSALRTATEEDRLSLEKLLREVENKRGNVIVISVEHEAGQKLLALGGIAALLRFPLS